MDIAKGAVGSVGDFDLEIKQGVASFKVEAKKDGIAAGVQVSVDAGVLLDKLAAAIPGVIDDAIIAVAKGAIAKL